MVIAGLLIGLAMETWFEVLVSCVGWGFVSWLFVVLLGGQLSFKLRTHPFFGSPRLARFIIWWTNGFATSLIAGSLTYAARMIFG
jgi:hypothetical protein